MKKKFQMMKIAQAKVQQQGETRVCKRQKEAIQLEEREQGEME